MSDAIERRNVQAVEALKQLIQSGADIKIGNWQYGEIVGDPVLDCGAVCSYNVPIVDGVRSTGSILDIVDQKSPAASTGSGELAPVVYQGSPRSR